ncbi:MAG: hypothetical protein WCL18_08760 [bacterium]
MLIKKNLSRRKKNNIYTDTENILTPSKVRWGFYIPYVDCSQQQVLSIINCFLGILEYTESVKKIKQKNNLQKQNIRIMKKLCTIVIIIIVCMTINGKAQITNVKLDDQVTLDRAYVGFLGGGAFGIDTVSFLGSVDIGAAATYRPAGWLAFSGLGVYKIDTKNSTAHFWTQINPHKKVTISVGYMGTLASEQRPKKVTNDDQFITFTANNVPGGTYNIKIVADSVGKFGFGICVAYRNNKLKDINFQSLEYQAMLKYNWMKISGWYGSDKKFGSALKIDFPRVSNITSWRQDQVLANFFCLKLGKKKDYQFISDNGYDFRTKTLVRSETGFLKTFESPNIANSFCIGGLFGITYKHETKSINAYVFIHPSPKHK